MIHELISDHEHLVGENGELIEISDAAQDQGTSDLLIERLRFHSKQAWLLRSHFEE
jgi:starvation-inducible DNA-binding protein